MADRRRLRLPKRPTVPPARVLPTYLACRELARRIRAFGARLVA